MVFLACRDRLIEKGTKLAAEGSADNNRRIVTGAVRRLQSTLQVRCSDLSVYFFTLL